MSRMASRTSDPRRLAVACFATLLLVAPVGCRPGSPSPAPGGPAKETEARPVPRTSDGAR